jgi:large subunit ribosomal protein L22
MTDKIDNKRQAYAKAKSIRTSGQKLNLVAKSIRGSNIKVAIDQLTFSKKRVSREVLKVLNSAIANAENNFGLDIDKLVVSEAYVGKSIVMKRMRARARGRAARILKPFSKLTILLKEIEEGK